MPSVREEIAKNLLFYRKKKGLTQKELAEKLGVKNTAVSNWESGNNSMDIEMLFRVCEIFGVTLNDMYGKYSVSKSSNLGISGEAQKIGAAYDKATPKEQQLVRLTLEEYLTDAPVRVAASSYGEPVDLSAADPDAPFSGGFNPGQDIP